MLDENCTELSEGTAKTASAIAPGNCGSNKIETTPSPEATPELQSARASEPTSEPTPEPTSEPTPEPTSEPTPDVKTDEVDA